MQSVIIDLTGPKSRQEIQELLAEKLAFPSYYGKNLDALADSLWEVETPAGIYLLTDKEPSSYVKTVIGIFRETEEARRGFFVYVQQAE